MELTSPSSGSSGNRIDLVTSEVDPSDDETGWFISGDADGPLLASLAAFGLNPLEQFGVRSIQVVSEFHRCLQSFGI